MKPGRNDPCPCGSGKKYKKCCAPGIAGAPAALDTGGDAGADGDPVPEREPTPGEISELVALMNAGHAAEFEACAEEFAHRFPASAIAWKLLSLSQWQQGKDPLHALQTAARLAPDDAEVHSSLGNALRRAGRTDEALNCQRRALAISPDYADAHNNLGRVLQDLGRLEPAAESYRTAATLKSGFAMAEVNLAGTLRQLGRLDESAECYGRVIALNPRAAEMHCILGDVQRERGQYEPAVAAYRSALALKPDYAEAQNNLGTTLRDLGRLDEAEACCRAALLIRPDLAEIHNNLGNVLQDLGRTGEAAASYQNALARNPDHVAALCNLAAILRDLAQTEAAESSYRRALALAPERAELHYNIAVVLRLQHRAAEAQASCRRALELKPDLTAARVFLGKLRADDGQFAEAENLFRQAIAIDPDSADAWSAIPALRRMTPADGDWLASATRVAARCLPPQKESHLRYAMGKYCDDLREYPAAFAHYQRANELRRALRPAYDRKARERAIDFAIESYEHRWSGQAGSESSTSSRPLFVVGMPRSGTTLVEQILAAHPAVSGAGELSFWSNAFAGELSATDAGGAADASIGRLAAGYLGRLEELAPDARHVVDKMPANFTFLGLIHAAFPNARIIHVRRHPIDTCLSIHFQDFEGGHLYANELADLAHYYRQYLRVMDHWRQVLPAAALMEVRYEALVRDQETWSRRLLEFAGLPWDSRCMDFQRNAGTVITASNWQVRQGISQASVERWRNYEPYIGPLADLAPAQRPGDGESRAE